jgi:hypothetical protein
MSNYRGALFGSWATCVFAVVILATVSYIATNDSTNEHRESLPPTDMIAGRVSNIDRFSVTLDAIDMGKITETYPRLNIRTALAAGFDEIRYRGRIYKYVPGAFGVLSLPDDSLVDRYLVSETHEERDDTEWRRITRIVVTDQDSDEVLATRVWWRQVGSRSHPKNSPGSHSGFLLSVFNPPPRKNRDYQLVPVTVSERTPSDFEYRDFRVASRIEGCGDDVQLHSTEFQQRWIETKAWIYGHWKSAYRIEQVYCSSDNIFLVLGTMGAESLRVEWLNTRGELRGHFFVTWPRNAFGRRHKNWVASIDITDNKILIDKRLVRHVMKKLAPEEMITSAAIEIDISQVEGDVPVRNRGYSDSGHLRPSFKQ